MCQYLIILKAANYLGYINHAAKTVYLAEQMGGKNVASKEGERGVLKPTLLDDYKRGLSNFKLLDCSRSSMATLDKESNSFWKRK